MRECSLPTGATLLLRPAENSDAAAMIAYAKQVGDESDFLSFSGADFTTTVEEEERIIENHALADNMLFLLALVEGRIVGMCNVAASQRPRLRHLGYFGISVARAYWGAGVGSHMLAYVMDWARDSGLIRKIELLVQTDNHRGIRLYQKFGFEYEGRLRRSSWCNDQFHDVYTMGVLVDPD